MRGAESIQNPTERKRTFGALPHEGTDGAAIKLSAPAFAHQAAGFESSSSRSYAGPALLRMTES